MQGDESEPKGKNDFEFYDYYCIILVYVYLKVLENKIDIEIQLYLVITRRKYNMQSKEVTIFSKTGLESKMAARLIQKASSYESNIWIQKGERKANAKSLLGLLSLGISPGDNITIITEGRDESTALSELEAFANNGMVE